MNQEPNLSCSLGFSLGRTKASALSSVLPSTRDPPKCETWKTKEKNQRFSPVRTWQFPCPNLPYPSQVNRLYPARSSPLGLCPVPNPKADHHPPPPPTPLLPLLNYYKLSPLLITSDRSIQPLAILFGGRQQETVRFWLFVGRLDSVQRSHTCVLASARGGGSSDFWTGGFEEGPMAGKEIYHKMKDKVTGNGIWWDTVDIRYWSFPVRAD